MAASTIGDIGVLFILPMVVFFACLYFARHDLSGHDPSGGAHAPQRDPGPTRRIGSTRQRARHCTPRLDGVVPGGFRPRSMSSNDTVAKSRDTRRHPRCRP
jgi:hypothetical protein